MNLRNIPVAAVAALERIPWVTRVEEDKYHPNLIKLNISTPLIRGLQSQINAADLSADGSGVRVCVCDTGIDIDHAMYADRIDFEASYDFHNGDSDPDDDHGHGAHVAGIAVGRTGLVFEHCGDALPFQGVAPEATLIGVKILDKHGGGSDSNIIAGIDHCADQSPSGGRADVINLSIGTGEFSDTCDSHTWALAANDAVDGGVVVVAAAGNEGYSNALASPACGSKVIAAGATYKDDYPNCEDNSTMFSWCLDWRCSSYCIDMEPRQDDLVCFSNNSDNLDVVAPGLGIWSANAAGAWAVMTMSGTSMASPHVAGLAALVLDMDPSLTPFQVRNYIRNGAIDMGPPDFDLGYGYGRIDVINTLLLVGALVADAGDNQVVFDEVTLDGSASYDEVGTIVSYEWALTHIKEPAYDRFAEGINPTVTDLAHSFYCVTLTVTDGDGNTATDTMLLGANHRCGPDPPPEVDDLLPPFRFSGCP
jgi:serine protease AprX